MPLAPGTQLGPYEISAPLGAGGMGEVYRARDARLERTVAIKILPAHLSSDPVRKQRFEREAKTISSLNHPHICVLYDVGSQDGVDYLVMECVEGETLAKRLEKGPLPLDFGLAKPTVPLATAATLTAATQNSPVTEQGEFQAAIPPIKSPILSRDIVSAAPTPINLPSYITPIWSDS